MAANMWKSSLKNVESDNNKILYETSLDFLQRNSTYCLSKPRKKKKNLNSHLRGFQRAHAFIFNFFLHILTTFCHIKW